MEDAGRIRSGRVLSRAARRSWPASHAAAFDITRKAYRIAQNGHVDTDLQFSEFFGDSFTLAAWVMPEFTYNWNGAIFTVKGLPGSGTFQVGQGDYRAGNGGFDKAGDPVLEVKLNGATALYLAPGYQRRKWNHIAIVRGNVMFAGPTLQLFVNGKKLQAFTGCPDWNGREWQSDLHLQASVGHPPEPGRQPGAGGLTAIGASGQGAVLWTHRRRGGLQQIDGPVRHCGSHERADRREQPRPHRGLYLRHLRARRSFSAAACVDAERARILGAECLPAQQQRRPSLFDNPFLVSPSSIVRRLPFPPGQVWNVNYEFDDKGGSHNGTAAFSWDFGRLDAATTQGLVIAAAPGLLSYVKDSANGAA